MLSKCAGGEACKLAAELRSMSKSTKSAVCKICDDKAGRTFSLEEWLHLPKALQPRAFLWFKWPLRDRAHCYSHSFPLRPTLKERQRDTVKNKV